MSPPDSRTGPTSPGGPAVSALTRARLYLCTDSRCEQGDLEEFLDAVLAAGVDVVQIREKGLEAAPELEALEVARQAADRHGRLVAANDRADVAVLAHTDVLHLGQLDLAPVAARTVVGTGPLIGRSTHTPAQFDAAGADPGIDYTCVGPVWATPTKPGRPAAGLDLLRHAAAAPDRIWFAIGGIDLTTVDEVVEAGARRVVVVRAITEADDPAHAVARLLDRLPPE
jgi:thiamine-phosphate pyrophosphorylase